MDIIICGIWSYTSEFLTWWTLHIQWCLIGTWTFCHDCLLFFYRCTHLHKILLGQRTPLLLTQKTLVSNYIITYCFSLNVLTSNYCQFILLGNNKHINLHLFVILKTFRGAFEAHFCRKIMLSFKALFGNNQSFANNEVWMNLKDSNQQAMKSLQEMAKTQNLFVLQLHMK